MDSGHAGFLPATLPKALAGMLFPHIFREVFNDPLYIIFRNIAAIKEHFHPFLLDKIIKV